MNRATIVTWSSRCPDPRVESFLRRPAVDSEAERAARTVLEEIRREGDGAVRRAAMRFDGCDLSRAGLRVTGEEFEKAHRVLDAQFKRVCRQAQGRIVRFARAGLRRSWRLRDSAGADMGERFVPFDRVGVYIPGGAAPLVSTVLMTVPLARVAGVPEIVACTPANREGRVDPHLLFALETAGATEVYRIGGVQAIGLMAFGTESVRRVQKIVGPGGPFVTAAKRLVYGEVAVDMVAGPSEIAVLADESARPDFVAADLLSQVEHGSGHEKGLLVTDSRKLAEAVRDALEGVLERLPRAEAVRTVLSREGVLLVVVPSLEEGVTLCEAFAPEHLEIMVRNARRWAARIRRAGAVFIGPWTPECVGDYAAGPSHVLPTGGTAAFFSGLTANDFLRRISVLEFGRTAFGRVWPIVETFSRIEGLGAHGLSGRIRRECS